MDEYQKHWNLWTTQQNNVYISYRELNFELRISLLHDGEHKIVVNFILKFQMVFYCWFFSLGVAAVAHAREYTVVVVVVSLVKIVSMFKVFISFMWMTNVVEITNKKKSWNFHFHTVIQIQIVQRSHRGIVSWMREKWNEKNIFAFQKSSNE